MRLSPAEKLVAPASMNKSRAFWAWVPCGTSLALFFGILSIAAHIRLGLGHWPTPMIVNHQTEFYSRHEKILGLIGLIALFIAGPLWAIFVAIPRFRQSP